MYLLAVLELLVALVADGVTGGERVGRGDGVGGGGCDGVGGGEGRDEEEEGGGVLHVWWVGVVWFGVLFCVWLRRLCRWWMERGMFLGQRIVGLYAPWVVV